jgi:uncharacterized protein
MNESITTIPNSKAKLQERFRAGHITWKWPLIIVFARLIFAVLAQALVAGLYMLKGHPTPWQAATPWWIVYGTLIDVCCFILLARLARREGIRLVDLINSQRQRLGRDLLLGLGFIPLFSILAIGGGILFGILIYGANPVPAVMVPLPLWGTLYSLIVWPLIWAFAEEMTYQGYALPRLELLSGRSWLAVIIVSFGWALQHIALPFMPDWRWTLFRFGSCLLVGTILPIIYLRTRRLLPFIIAHWAANFVSVLMTVVLPSMTL